MNTEQKTKKPRVSIAVVVTIIAVSLAAGTLLGYSLGNVLVSRTINSLQNQLSLLQESVANQQATQNVTTENNTYILGQNVSLPQLYEQIKDSVVVIRGITVQYDIFHRPYYSEIQGSGFVYNYTGEIVIITNNHVVQSTINTTVTFTDGNGYAATVIGNDPYADLAVLTTNASQDEYKPLQITRSSTLEVGDPVMAVGTPYGLAGSMTTGIVSALGRTITEDLTGGYPIADVIQTSTPINPGNSGGPLLDYQGQVVGITTAIVSNSQGLGFAIPSNTILREITSLVTTGSYTEHPTLGATGTDMTYEIAQAMKTNVTYGWLIATAPSQTGLKGGTSQVVVAGSLVTIGGDIITGINGTRITNLDDLSTYLEENALPGQTVNLTVIRNNSTMNIAVELGSRPQLNA